MPVSLGELSGLGTAIAAVHLTWQNVRLNDKDTKIQPQPDSLLSLCNELTFVIFRYNWADGGFAFFADTIVFRQSWS
jgi:hypothetical protein